MKRKSSNQSSFNFEEEACLILSPVQDQVLVPGAGTWKEVPQARFLSWSDAMQDAYCAARDRNSAECAENEEWKRFYLERAERYAS